MTASLRTSRWMSSFQMCQLLGEGPFCLFLIWYEHWSPKIKLHLKRCFMHTYKVINFTFPLVFLFWPLPKTVHSRKRIQALHLAAKRGEVETLSKLLDRSLVGCEFQSCFQHDWQNIELWYIFFAGQSSPFVGRAPLERVCCTLQLPQKGEILFSLRLKQLVPSEAKYKIFRGPFGPWLIPSFPKEN